MRRFRLGLAGAAASAALVGLPAASASAAPTVLRTGGPSAPAESKVAVIGTDGNLRAAKFRVVEGSKVVLRGTLRPAPGSSKPWRNAYRADLSAVRKPGSYRVLVAGKRSRAWVVRPQGSSSLIPQLLRFMQTNRDGNEPALLHGPSHLNDAVISGGPHDGVRVDLTGGWMDAGDMIRFTQTTAFTAAMLDAAARLDPANRAALRTEADVGVRWLLKAHPFPDVFVTQVAGEIDHDLGFRDPVADDRSMRTGVGTRLAFHAGSGVGSDIGGQVAAALALASDRETDPFRAAALRAVAAQWYAAGRETAGPSPVVPGTGGFYESEVWKGAMAAGAAALHRSTGDPAYLEQALAYLAASGDEVYAPFEPGALGAFAAADICGALGAAPLGTTFQQEAGCKYLKTGASAALDYSKENAFAPASYFVWGTSGVSSALGAQAALAKDGAGFKPGGRIAAGARDYLLGRNAWGASFVAGVGPKSPKNIHHWASVLGRKVGLPEGAVVGGPAPRSEVKSQGFKPGGKLAVFDGDIVYADSRPNYVNSEPALDYGAKAILLLAALSGSE